MATKTYTSFAGLMVAENDNGTERSYLSDVQGSNLALADSSQSITDTYDYWPYGEVRASTGVSDTPMKYVGAYGVYQDSDELTYIRHRHYMPGYGRWAQRDAVAADWTRYSYAGDDPINFIDINGLLLVDPERAPGTTSTVITSTGVIITVIGIGVIMVAAPLVGIIALAGYDLYRWGTTGETGPLTGLGTSIGKQIFPSPTEETITEKVWNDRWREIGEEPRPFPGGPKPGLTVATAPAEEPYRGVPGPLYYPGSECRQHEPCAEICDFFCTDASSLGAPDGIPTPTDAYGDCFEGCVDACRNGAQGFTFWQMTLLFWSVNMD